MNRCITTFVTLANMAKTLRNKSLVFVVACIFSMTTQGQETGVVLGRVLGSDDTPVEGALLSIEALGVSVSSASDGRYRFGVIAPGNYELTVDYLGQNAITLDITVTAGETTEQNIQLTEYIEEEVVVTAAGQTSALNKERAADNLRTVVAADAISGFPDSNVAESLSRLPGISIDRSEGEGTEVILRGLGTEFNQVTLEGATIPNTNSGNSGLEMDILPSDLLEGIEVSKTLTPDLDGDSIGGQVRLRSVNAFDRGGFSARLRLEGNYHELRDEVSPRIALSWTDIFDLGSAGELGLALSGSYFDREMALDQIRADRGLEVRSTIAGEDFGEELPLEQLGADDTAVFPGEIEQRVQSMDRERASLGFNIDWRPTDSAEYRVRLFATDFDDVETRWRNEIELRRSEGSDETDSLGSRTGVLDDVEIEKRIRLREFNQTIRSIKLGGTNTHSAWTFDYDVAYSKTEEKNPYRYRLQFDDAGSDGFANVVYSYNDEDAAIGQLPREAGENPDSIFAASSYVLDDVRNQKQLREDEIQEFNVDIERELQWGNLPGSLKFGAKLRQREKSADESQIFYRNLDDAFSETLADFGTIEFNDYTYGDFVGPHISEAAAREFILEVINNPELTEEALEDRRTIIAEYENDFDSARDVTSAYVMGSVNLSNAMRLVAGVRVEQTDWEASAFQVVDNVSEPTVTELSTTDDYTNFLPSVNFRLDISDDLLFRAGYYASLRRPNFNDKTPLAALVPDDRSVLNLGNADLEAIEADNVDLGIAYYFGGNSVLQAGIFYKRLDNFFVELVQTGDQVPTEVSVGEEFDPIAIDPDDVSEVNQTINGDTAEIVGLELTYHQAYTFLPSPLSGLYTTANLTLMDSEADYGPVIEAARGSDLELVEQSELIANLQVGYDKGPWDVRISGNYRSEYLDEVNTTAALDDIQADFLVWDFGLNYSFNDTYRVYFDVNNLTDEKDLAQQRGFDGRIFRVNQLAGRSVALGFRAHFK